MNLNKIKNINLLFIFVIILLSLTGTAALYSAGDGNFDPWAIKHIIRFTLSLTLLMLIALIDIKIFYKYSYGIFFLCLLLLFSVEIIGTFEKGAERWISIFGISLQPAELIKISIIMALAKFYHNLKIQNIGKIRNLIIPIIIISLPFILIVMQPDLGTAISIVLLGFSIMFLAFKQNL